MKTRTQKQNVFIVALSLIALALTGCGKESSSSVTSSTNVTYAMSGTTCYSSTGVAVSSNYCGFYSSNGYCYNSSGQNVDTSYCDGTASTGYYLSNGYCYNGSGQVVNSGYCGTSTTTTTSQRCVGYFYYFNGYMGQWGYCNGYNCSGYTLMSQSGQWVNCQ